MGKKTEQTDSGVAYLRKDDLYKKSNMLISAKYKASILENKILAIALSKLQTEAVETEDGRLMCNFPAAMLREFIGDEQGNIYRKLKPVAEHMTATRFAFDNPETHEFAYYNLIDNAVYSGGVFHMEFGTAVKRYMSNLTERYTLLNLPVMLDFSSSYAFRLYEILKSQAYREKHQGQYTIYGFEMSFSVAELKLELGVVDTNQASVKKVLDKKKYPDYEQAVSTAYKYKNLGDDVALFESWRNFKRHVLDVAVKEINEVTDLNVEYYRTKSGRGGKTTGVVFRIITKDMIEKQEQQTTYIIQGPGAGPDIDDLADSVRKIISEPISTKEAKSILKAADNDIERISAAYTIASQQEDNIENIVGWMITAVKEKYSAPKKKGKKNSFNNFDQRDYDFDKLERELKRED